MLLDSTVSMLPPSLQWQQMPSRFPYAGPVRPPPIEAAEEMLPRNLCPLIKSSYGFAATDTCPFFKFSDIIVADTTCDGKKKMFELMSDIKPVHVLQLPQQQDFKAFLEPWKNEIEKLISVLEKTTGKKITREKISSAIALLNREKARILKKRPVSF